MVDRLTPERRSWNMSRIRAGDTGPEKAVRSLLHGMGFRFRLRPGNLPGRPDIVLPKYRTAIFVHGCFWHRHEGCPFAYNPKTRPEFWEKKFEDNIHRDRKVRDQLGKQNWNVIMVWECELKNTDKLSRRLIRVFRS
jgi:DNA mismatch endonuclease (patch repair protein)